jgi:hypothetical protein
MAIETDKMDLFDSIKRSIIWQKKQDLSVRKVFLSIVKSFIHFMINKQKNF